MTRLDKDLLRNDPVRYSVRRYFVDEFLLRMSRVLPGDFRIIDIGGKKRNKRGCFNAEDMGLDVTYLNMDAKTDPDVRGNAEDLPFLSGTFSAAICSEVLEHVRNPAVVLEEIQRILVHQGRILLCVPFNTAIHGDPDDYRRFTDTCLREMLAGAGFSGITVERQGLFFCVLADMLRAGVLHWCNSRNPSRFLVAATRLSLRRLRRWAIKRECDRSVAHAPFTSRYTTGFAVSAFKHN